MTLPLRNQCLWLLLFMAVLQRAYLSPVSTTPHAVTAGKIPIRDDITAESFEEKDDFNIKKTDPLGLLNSKETSESPSKLLHHDEDQYVKDSFDSEDDDDNDSDENPKSDAEELETSDEKRPTVELEEQFRGSALKFNTDTITNEDIEVSAVRTSNPNAEQQQSHIYIGIILVTLALVSIGLYAALVFWRSHLEHRYGMRELLVNQDDDDCNASPYSPTTSPLPQQFSVLARSQSQS